MGKQALIVLEQCDHGTNQTQVPAPLPTRGYPAQQRHGSWSVLQQQFDPQAHHDQQGQGKEGKQARPRFNGFEPRLGKAQFPLRVCKRIT